MFNKKTFIIMKREITTRIFNKVFLGVMAFLLVGAVGGSCVGAYLTQKPAEKITYALTDSAAGLQAAIKTGDANSKVIIVKDYAEGKADLKNGKAKILVDLKGSQIKVVTKTQYTTVSDQLKTFLVSYASQGNLAESIAKLGGNPAEIMKASADVKIKEDTLEKTSISKNMSKYFVGLACSMMLFFLIFMGGSLIAQGIAEEKGGKIVEVLLSTVKPTQLMAGKVIGIGIVNFVQFAVPLAAGLITSGCLGLLKQLPDINVGSIAIVLAMWFIVGYLSYAVVFAAFGATASNQDDAKTAIMPITLVSVLALYAGIYMPMTLAANSIWLHIAVWCPFISIYVAPTSFAMGVIGLPEMLGSFAVSVVVLPLAIWVSAKVYQRSVLLSGTTIWSRFANKKK
ncbi:MAG: ABC transporter permease [Lactobacillales bacterium]|jgi:ABC-2 type transport system permease protein|nr:ABC transporter permease [Lactobacillales bacterium]